MVVGRCDECGGIHIGAKSFWMQNRSNSGVRWLLWPSRTNIRYFPSQYHPMSSHSMIFEAANHQEYRVDRTKRSHTPSPWIKSLVEYSAIALTASITTTYSRLPGYRRTSLPIFSDDVTTLAVAIIPIAKPVKKSINNLRVLTFCTLIVITRYIS